jgi:hypothetical protein
MSIYNTNNNNTSDIPKLTLISYNITEVSPEVECIVLDKNIPEAVGFNNVLRKGVNGIYGFMTRYDQTPDVKNIVKIFNIMINHPMVAYLYTDRLMYRNNTVIEQFHPSASTNNLTHSIVQTPVFIKMPPILFDEKLQELFIYKMIFKLSQISVGIHEPNFIFQTQFHPINNLEEELKVALT